VAVTSISRTRRHPPRRSIARPRLTTSAKSRPAHFALCGRANMLSGDGAHWYLLITTMRCGITTDGLMALSRREALGSFSRLARGGGG
jgi:hypothetical protein